MRQTMLRLTLVLALPLLAACDDDSTGPSRLTLADVSGNFAACQLVFTPTNTVLPAVDLRASAFEPGGGLILPPVLRINPSGELAFTFTPRGENIERTLTGQVSQLGTTSANIGFTDAAAAGNVLFPREVRLNFDRTARTFSVERSQGFLVPRAAFARLAGISESGLATQIEGTLTANFQVNQCT